MPIRNAAAISALIAVLASGGAHAQTVQRMDHASHHTGMSAPPPGAVPTLPGQDAFGAIQEIVGILEADPNTDWSRVDIEALRRHLIDMNAVTLAANVVAMPVDGGARYEVTGEGRTLEALRRMIPAHAHAIDGMEGWTAKAEPTAEGVVLTVTAADPRQAAKIRGLGFLGILVQGAHHTAHHLAMAKGEFGH
jgi:hypothetical protein